MQRASYAIALGSNRRTRHGSPRATLIAAIAALARVGRATARSPIIDTAPLGPSHRRFANAAVLVESDLAPDELLDQLKRIERDFGRRSGRRWGQRSLDLDIILWSRGAWASPGLVVPHAEFRTRSFVLEPLAAIAADWRDPISGATVRQIGTRAKRQKAKLNS